MDWWSELWLNEGFATWVGWLATDKIHPEWNVVSTLGVMATTALLTI
jgi:aminopeptidase N